MRVVFMFDKRLMIQRFVSSKDANTGQKIGAWVTLSTIWGGLASNKGGSEKIVEGAQVVATQNAVFSIRWRSDIRKTDRIFYDGEVYDIEQIVKIGRRKYLNLVCKNRDCAEDSYYIEGPLGDYELFNGTVELSDLVRTVEFDWTYRFEIPYSNYRANSRVRIFKILGTNTNGVQSFCADREVYENDRIVLEFDIKTKGTVELLIF